MLRLYLITIIMLLAAGSMFGCDEDFTEVNAEEFQAKFDLAKQSDFISWWYLGEGDGYYYLVEKDLWEEAGYKISKEYITVNLENPEIVSSDESEWVNLKEWDIIFKPGSMTPKKGM